MKTTMDRTTNGIRYSLDYVGKNAVIATITAREDDSDDAIRQAKRWLYSKFDIPHGGIVVEKKSLIRNLMPLNG